MPNFLYISTDGLRPDAIYPDTTPNLWQLKTRARYSMQARSVMPSVTLPCHMSIFHSVPPERHNVLSNTYVPMVRPFDGLVETLSKAGKRCGFFYSWEPLRDVVRPLHLAHSSFIAYADNPEISDDKTVAEFLPYLKAAAFDFMFLYLGSIDEVGHLSGWMSQEYLEQAQHVDALLGDIFDALPANTSMLIHSDHGGHKRMHGTDNDEDMLIPWFLYGEGVAAGETSQAISLLDTAPTIAAFFELAAPVQWEGRSLLG